MYSIVSDRILFNLFDECDDCNGCNEKVNGMRIFSKQFWWENAIYYYVNGKKHGLCEKWNKNDRLWEKCNYFNGKKHGIYEYWYKNGQSWEKCNYFNVKKQC